MTTSTTEFARELHDRGAESVLVRGRPAPAGSVDDVVTFDAGTVAVCRGDYWHLPLYVTTPTADGRTRRRFGSTALADAIDHAERMLREHAPDGVWLRHHERLVDCLCPATVGALEARLARTAGTVDATLVTWTGATTPADDASYDCVVEF
ncbi:hypothetical protein [Haladaptatus salinisoli]|uniref:hypothetical protein n=1 Tax=Haladaptatus salinisoli TaxID=2884876 RepID=UPI001D0A70F0|nr:hypothetical protein [Haladaptatus salinisoli]